MRRRSECWFDMHPVGWTSYSEQGSRHPDNRPRALERGRQQAGGGDDSQDLAGITSSLRPDRFLVPSNPFGPAKGEEPKVYLSHCHRYRSQRTPSANLVGSSGYWIALRWRQTHTRLPASVTQISVVHTTEWNYLIIGLHFLSRAIVRFVHFVYISIIKPDSRVFVLGACVCGWGKVMRTNNS